MIAIATNLGAQELLTLIYTGASAIFLSMGIGTGCGLVVKYILDKKYIFNFSTYRLGRDMKIFLMYSILGLATTSIFWAFEIAFNYFFETKEMRYFGATLGLAIGYYSKYQLDKRFVFIK
jgi:putative flippase GtrA